MTFWSALGGISNFESKIFFGNCNFLTQFITLVALTEISLKLQSLSQKTVPALFKKCSSLYKHASFVLTFCRGPLFVPRLKTWMRKTTELPHSFIRQNTSFDTELAVRI